VVIAVFSALGVKSLGCILDSSSPSELLWSSGKIIKIMQQALKRMRSRWGSDKTCSSGGKSKEGAM